MIYFSLCIYIMSLKKIYKRGNHGWGACRLKIEDFFPSEIKIRKKNPENHRNNWGFFLGKKKLLGNFLGDFIFLQI